MVASRFISAHRIRGCGASILTACICALSASPAVSEEIIFQNFSKSTYADSYDFDNPANARLSAIQEIERMRARISERLPTGTQFVRDRRGVGPQPMDRRARFLSVKTPVIGDEITGAYVTIGFGRDRDMKEASDRQLATKMVAGARWGLGKAAETFVEYRQVRGFDFRGVSAPEHQASIGLTIKF